MEPRRSAFVGVSALVSLALLAGSSQSVRGAGHGGGGHGGGGGHWAGGGFHGGGFHPGGFCGRGFYGPGFCGRGFCGPGFCGRGYYGRGFYPGFYGYPWWYGGFGLGLGLGYGLGYGYGYPYYPVGVPAYGGPACYGQPACAATPLPAAPAPVAAAAAVQVAATDVLFSIRVPDSADVWINGEKTTQNGPRREFVSSGLEQGRSYTFDIRARWPAPDGTTVQLERRVSVQGGQRRSVDFLMPAPNPLRN